MKSGKKIFVSGADGFIGSHLVEELVRQGHSVVALAQYNSFGKKGWLDTIPKDVLAGLDVVLGDVRDQQQMRDLVKGQELVFHLAALIGIPYSYAAPQSYVDTNITGTLNILEAAKEFGIEKLIHTSTSEVYGTAQYVPIDEDHPLQGQSPYSATKIAADQIAYSYFASFDLPVTIIRPFNTYGPRQSTRAVIPTIITQIASGSRCISLGAVQPTRDFNYVGDTVAGFVAASRSSRCAGEVINIGSNFEISVKETVHKLAECFGVDVEILADDARLRPKKSEVERLWADNSKALELLDWSPEYSGKDGFQRGLSKTVDWFSDKKNLALYDPSGYMV